MTCRMAWLPIQLRGARIFQADRSSAFPSPGHWQKKAAVYIFDDSFSALDAKTDAALRHALKDATKDAAVIIIAQRVSTILHADQILVLDDGKIAGLGTHSWLLEHCPVYKDIVRSQLRDA